MSSAALGALEGIWKIFCPAGTEPISRLARLGGIGWLFLDHLSLHKACPSSCPQGQAARVRTRPRCPADGSIRRTSPLTRCAVVDDWSQIPTSSWKRFVQLPKSGREESGGRSLRSSVGLGMTLKISFVFRFSWYQRGF